MNAKFPCFLFLYSVFASRSSLQWNVKCSKYWTLRPSDRRTENISESGLTKNREKSRQNSNPKIIHLLTKKSVLEAITTAKRL